MGQVWSEWCNPDPIPNAIFLVVQLMIDITFNEVSVIVDIVLLIIQRFIITLHNIYALT